MRKLPKRPRTFGRKKAVPYQQKHTFMYESATTAPQRLPVATIQFMDELQPGFAKWYRRNYDEQGKYIGNELPGLS